MSDLRALGLVKRFVLGDETLEVLRGVDLSVRPGESLAVLGVSGAGKSTLLHLLGGIDTPDEGQVLFGGADVARMKGPEKARFRNHSVGFVFQFHHLLPEFDAEENVMMPALLAGWTRRRARERARELLDGVGMGHRLRHNPGKLSGGERQRVAIARALVHAPPVVLADEPTGNLDPHTAEEVEELFLGLNQRAGTALVLVTHNENLANRLSKKAFLVEGRLES
ncbi:MAG: ABC transporter ATP-binding protein [Proteobacteria bacterium]|nr:ABC transporter ATP-binding protein [Pseudomonadota bacterium]